MGVQADDAGADVAHGRRRLVELGEWDPELRVRAGGAHVAVVPAAAPGVEAQEELAAGEGLRPALQRPEVVEGDPHAAREGVVVLGAWREVGGEEDALGHEVGEKAEHVGELARRDALEAEARGVEDPQHAGVRVGLDRVEDAVERRQRDELLGGPFQRAAVVDVHRRRLRGDGEQRFALLPPPRLRRGVHAALAGPSRRAAPPTSAPAARLRPAAAAAARAARAPAAPPARRRRRRSG